MLFNSYAEINTGSCMSCACRSFSAKIEWIFICRIHSLEISLKLIEYENSGSIVVITARNFLLLASLYSPPPPPLPPTLAILAFKIHEKKKRVNTVEFVDWIDGQKKLWSGLNKPCSVLSSSCYSHESH